MISVLEKAGNRERVAPISVETYHRLYEMGGIPEKTELVAGVIFKKMPKSPEHTFAVEFIRALLAGICPAGFFLRQESPLTIEDSEPEPDLCLVPGTPEAFRHAHPQSALLVVEVCKSTYDLDFDKQLVYAAAGADHYWIVNLEKREIEIYDQPLNGAYKERRVIPGSQPFEWRGLELKLGPVFE